MRKIENKKVAELILSFGNANIRKLLKEMVKGKSFYKTFNDTKSILRN